MVVLCVCVVWALLSACGDMCCERVWYGLCGAVHTAVPLSFSLSLAHALPLSLSLSLLSLTSLIFCSTAGVGPVLGLLGIVFIGVRGEMRWNNSGISSAV